MGLNPTILRQAQAFAFSRPRRAYRASGLVVCRACSVAWRWKSSTQP